MPPAAPSGQHAEGQGSEIGLTIVIPVYRSASTIRPLVEELARLEPAGGLEIVLVDDGSPDGAGGLCLAAQRELAVPITFVEHSRNFGEHNAVLTGLRHARGAYVVTMDDDFQNPPDQVLRLYDEARLGGWDVVYAHHSRRRHAFWRNVTSRIAHRGASWLIGKPRTIAFSTFRCMDRFVVHQLIRYSGPFPFIDGLVFQVTDRVTNVQVRHAVREQGRSTYTVRRLVRLWLAMATGFSIIPLRLCMIGAALAALLGLIEAGLVLWGDLLGFPASEFRLHDPAMLFIGSVQFFFLGVVGEYLGRLLLLANGKPQSVVRRVVSPARASQCRPTTGEDDLRG